jgi:hypothetical protein
MQAQVAAGAAIATAAAEAKSDRATAIGEAGIAATTADRLGENAMGLNAAGVDDGVADTDSRAVTA